jgi:hypothetical protein
VLQTLAVCAIAGGQSRTIIEQPTEPVAPSARRDAGGVLDFWIGRWDVFGDDGRRIGTSVIEKILGGRAVLDSWRGVGGDERKYLYIHKPAAGEWTEVTVMKAGGWREKILVDSAPGTVRFQGELAMASGALLLDRTTFIPLEAGRVRRIVERSRDGGVSWQRASSVVCVRRDDS